MISAGSGRRSSGQKPPLSLFSMARTSIISDKYSGISEKYSHRNALIAS